MTGIDRGTFVAGFGTPPPEGLQTIPFEEIAAGDVVTGFPTTQPFTFAGGARYVTSVTRDENGVITMIDLVGAAQIVVEPDARLRIENMLTLVDEILEGGGMIIVQCPVVVVELTEFIGNTEQNCALHPVVGIAVMVSRPCE